MKLFSTHAMQKPLEEVVFKELDSPFDCTFGSTAQLLRRITDGEPFDVLIGVTASFAGLGDIVDIRQRQTLARVGIGLAVAPTNPLPPISSLSALKRALIGARSVAYSRTGASGIYFAELLEELGLAEEINAKATVVETGLVAETVLEGHADVAVQLLSELSSVPRARIVGPFPPEVQQYTEFSAAPAKHASRDTEILNFIAFLTSPAARKAYTQALMEI